VVRHLRIETRWRVLLLIVLVTAGGCVRPPPVTRVDTVTETPLARAVREALAAAEPGELEGEPLDLETLRTVYAARRNAPLWVDGSGKTDGRAEEAAAVLADATTEGLDPRDYHADAIRRRLATRVAGDAVALELLLTDGVVRYAVHQANGVRPPTPRDPEHGDPDAALVARELADASDTGARLRAFAPSHAPYRRLRDALALYRDIEANGGWPMVPETGLRPGMTDSAVPTLRRRLAISGDLEDEASLDLHYDEDLATAVRRFQWRHGIGSDGGVGRGTLTALNVPVGRRIDAIIANMERWRWFDADLAERYVRVNVPDYTLELVQSGSAVLTMPVVVGGTDWRTPVLSSEIRRVVFNPSWSVPTSIATKEIMPKARADPSYLKREGLVVKGERLRQPPGPRNPLGRMKFEMPNSHGVYLHDTPSRRGFARAKRALSHGCIRLRDPMLLADAVLATNEDWSEERRAKILSTWRTHSIKVADPVPVVVSYETAWVDELGAVHFREDVYESDPALRQEMTDAGRAALAARSRPQRTPERAVALP
jgi:L,D-transpeptidase YcbB